MKLGGEGALCGLCRLFLHGRPFVADHMCGLFGDRMRTGVYNRMNDGLLSYRHWLTGSGAAGTVGGIGLAFIEAFIALVIIAKKIAESFGRVDILVIVVAKRDDGSVLIHHADKDRAIAMPPAIVVDEFFSVG